MSASLRSAATGKSRACSERIDWRAARRSWRQASGLGRTIAVGHPARPELRVGSAAARCSTGFAGGAASQKSLHGIELRMLSNLRLQWAGHGRLTPP